MNAEYIENVRFSSDGTSVIILDQTLLPHKTVFLELSEADELFEAISVLRVRGAPAIGIFAAFALYVIARKAADEHDDYDSFLAKVLGFSSYLCSARPTAVNLSRQLGRMETMARSLAGSPVSVTLEAMKSEALAIQREDVDMCRAISEYGLTLIRDGDGILTHCNAGPLATSKYGTGLGAILLAAERGMHLKVYCDETRPLLQGARLTVYELMKAGVDCTLICDNMASIVMHEGKIDAVFTGCDRVARNGDAANKIGTSGAAIIAKHYGVPFYIFCPSTTIDRACETGAEIVIEQRPPHEIASMFFEKPIAPEGAKCYNPAFDVTKADLITAIITEKGIFRAPYNF